MPPKSSKSLTNLKSSDRRLASGRSAASYLHSSLAQAKNEKFQYKPAPTQVDPNLTVKREVGDSKWTDPSLLEWDPNHFRLFVGNLGPDANDELLYRAFSKYPSLSKAKVPMNKKKNENKGYGFVAFADSGDYLKAFKEMNGKYVGQHPVQLKRAQTEIKPVKKKGRR